MRGSRAVTKAELGLLLHATNRLCAPRIAWRHSTLLVVMASTGLRAGEACQLQVGDVSRGGRASAEIYIRKCTTKGQHSGTRAVVCDYCREWLDAWLAYSGLASAPAHAWLFPASRGGTRDSVHYQYGRHVTSAGVQQLMRQLRQAAQLDGKVSSHSLRKYFAGHIYEATGRDIVAVQEALRHSDIRNTRYYLGYSRPALEAAMRGAL